jgi:hypothetical protein
MPRGLRDLNGELPINSDWRMDVADETGATVLTLKFIQTIPAA